VPYTDHPVWTFQVNWESGVLEQLEWKTGVYSSELDAEQRVQHRLTPRRSLEAEFLVEGVNRQYLQTLLVGKGASTWVVPIWQQASRLTAAATSATIQLDTKWSEFAVGSLVVIVGRDAQIFDVGVVQALTDSSIDLIQPTDIPWPEGSAVYPAMLARLEDVATPTKLTDGLFHIRARFKSHQPNRFVAGVGPDAFNDSVTKYNYAPVLSLAPNDEDQQTFELRRLLNTVDNGVGLASFTDVTMKSRRRFSFHWTLRGRREEHELRQLLYWVRGKTRLMWLPSSMNDLTLAVDAWYEASEIRIKKIGYVDQGLLATSSVYLNVKSPLRRRPVYRYRIAQAVDNGDGTETLKLASMLDYGHRVGDGSRFSHLHKVRIDQDAIELSHPADVAGVTEVSLTFTEDTAAILPTLPVLGMPPPPPVGPPLTFGSGAYMARCPGTGYVWIMWSSNGPPPFSIPASVGSWTGVFVLIYDPATFALVSSIQLGSSDTSALLSIQYRAGYMYASVAGNSITPYDVVTKIDALTGSVVGSGDTDYGGVISQLGLITQDALSLRLAVTSILGSGVHDISSDPPFVLGPGATGANLTWAWVHNKTTDVVVYAGYWPEIYLRGRGTSMTITAPWARGYAASFASRTGTNYIYTGAEGTQGVWRIDTLTGEKVQVSDLWARALYYSPESDLLYIDSSGTQFGPRRVRALDCEGHTIVAMFDSRYCIFGSGCSQSIYIGDESFLVCGGGPSGDDTLRYLSFNYRFS
jgi:hypothetical protein